jgi:hypothetical protein
MCTVPQGNAPLKRRSIPTRLHGALSQKAVIFLPAAVRTWILTVVTICFMSVSTSLWRHEIIQESLIPLSWICMAFWGDFSKTSQNFQHCNHKMRREDFKWKCAWFLCTKLTGWLPAWGIPQRRYRVANARRLRKQPGTPFPPPPHVIVTEHLATLTSLGPFATIIFWWICQSSNAVLTLPNLFAEHSFLLYFYLLIYFFRHEYADNWDCRRIYGFVCEQLCNCFRILNTYIKIVKESALSLCGFSKNFD